MKNKKPPFEITNAIIGYVAEIAELVGKLTSTNQLSANPTLRRANRIRTIHGSLAIEQNTLTLEQVTAVLNGKQVLAPPKDIAEVKNAYEIYERLDELNPFSVDDLLTAHGIMTRGLVDESGVFRSKPVGVVDQEGHVLHFGTLPQYVPDLVIELLDWVKNSDVHMLIRSCVFHYELELIHPFADGNGRVGRLWHTLLLSKWNPAFAWLPVESIIHDRQQEYYVAQQNYANYMDANKGVVLQSALTERERLQNDMNLAYQVYSQVATQLQVARAKVQEAKPVFAVVEPASVPLLPSGTSKKVILVGFIFLAVAGASAWILFGREFFENLKAGLNAPQEGMEKK
jgi:Fic family protein